jgi:hypothetical protein
MAVLAAALTVAAPAIADPDKWTWQGYGTGSNNCTRYKMTNNVSARDGRAVGDFYQEGRTLRKFDFPLDGGGAFSGDVRLDGGNKIRVKGNLGTDGSTLTLDGYCKFGGKLKKA